MKTIFKIYYLILRPIFFVFFPMRVIHRERIPNDPILVCANHSKLADPIILCFVLGIKRFIRFMAKIELMRAPVVGTMLKWIGTFGVDRGNSDVGAIKTAMRILKEGGNLGIFPEGTRVMDERDSAAKTGAIMLAARTGVPILPVYIPRDKKLCRRFTVVVGEPYSIERVRGSESYDPLAKELMSKINALSAEA